MFHFTFNIIKGQFGVSIFNFVEGWNENIQGLGLFYYFKNV